MKRILIGNNCMTHYGILGMHWGKRASGRVTKIKAKPAKTQTSDDHKRKVSLSGKKIHEMSNDQLRDLTNRLQLEKNIRQLKPNNVQRGLNIVKNITAAGTTMASLYALSTTPLAKDLAKVMKGAIK